MRKKMLLYLVLPFSIAFVIFTLAVSIYVSEIFSRYEIRSANWMLIYSIGAGMFLCLLKVAALSLRVTKPLDKMKTAALGIKSGDYSAQTGVKQSDEIGELATILDDVARQLGEASDANAASEKRRQEFMANISHELRTPIAVIRSSLEALCDGVITDPQMVADYHRQMHAESLHLERMVSDLLELARLQSPEFSMETEPVDIKDIVSDAVRGMIPAAAAKGVALTCPEPEASYYIQPILGDYGRLKQMLAALLDNAVKFTPAGKNITVRLFDLEGKMCIAIQDEGGGIAEDDLPYIFERFYKAHSPENAAGTGLGLSIAKHIADRHGAEIVVESNPGHGTEVKIIWN